MSFLRARAPRDSLERVVERVAERKAAEAMEREGRETGQPLVSQGGRTEQPERRSDERRWLRGD